MINMSWTSFDYFIWDISLVVLAITSIVGLIRINTLITRYLKKRFPTEENTKEEDEDEDIKLHIFHNIDEDHETVIEGEDSYEIAILDKAVSMGVKIGCAEFIDARDKIAGVNVNNNCLKLTNPSDRFNTKSFIDRDHITIEEKRFIIHFEMNDHAYIIWNTSKEICLVDFLIFVISNDYATDMISFINDMRKNS